MNCTDMEVSVMSHFGVRQNVIVPNVSWGMFYDLHECDLLLLTKSNYATEIEIKVSKQDLLKDKEKKHNHFHKNIARLYFAVPEKLEEIALKEIPERAGLLVGHKLKHDWGFSYHIKEVRSPIRNKNALKWTEEERNKLTRLGTMRILGLKKKIAAK